MNPAGPLLKTLAELPPAIAALPRGDILLPYQSTALQSAWWHKLLVIEKSRRIGLTWGLAAHAVLVAAAQKSAGGMNVFYMGYEREMTREFVEVCAMWARAFQIAAGDVEEEVFRDEQKDFQVFRLRFSSGFSITALPSVPRALRGRQGLVILDEAAFMSALAEILKAALALLMWGGSVIVVSTHDGVDNPFNVLIEEIKAGRRKGGTLRISFADALAQGLYERICLVRGETPTAEGKVAWEAEIRAIYGEAASEELDCIPSSGAGSWISPELITAAEHDEAGRPELYQGGLCYGGWDVARRNDLSVIWPFEQVANVLWLRETIEMRGARFSEQYDAVDRVFAVYRMVGFGIDQTGMGEAVVEEVQARHGAYRVQGVLLTGPTKLVLATHLRDRFEAGTIRIPRRPEIRTDLRAVKKVAGPGGAPRLVDGDVHPDRFWAAALATYLAATPWQQYDYRSALAALADRARRDFWQASDDDAPRAERSGLGGLRGTF